MPFAFPLALAIALAFPLPIVSAAPNPHSVVLLFGQSNAAGRATATAVFPPADPTDARVLFHYDTDTTSAFANLRTSGGKFVPLGPTSNQRFGPEIGLARELVAADISNPVIIKFARGGTNLHTDWDPDATEGRQLYAAWLAHLRTALAELDATGIPYEIIGACWMQGESDSDRAADYEKNLTAFMARVRADLAMPDLPFVIGRVGPRENNPGRDTVREAQVRVADATPHAAWIDTDDLHRFDGTHYDAPAMLELGRRFARTLILHLP
jgi:hypothetical protein